MRASRAPPGSVGLSLPKLPECGQHRHRTNTPHVGESEIKSALRARKEPATCGLYSGLGNGAGGNRTPVPKRPTRRFYACSRWFDLNLRTAIDSLPPVQSPVIYLAASPPGTPGVGQPAVIDPSRSRHPARVRLPGYQAAMRYCSSADICVAWFLRGHHAPRRATPNLKQRSVETTSAPIRNSSVMHLSISTRTNQPGRSFILCTPRTPRKKRASPRARPLENS